MSTPAGQLNFNMPTSYPSNGYPSSGYTPQPYTSSGPSALSQINTGLGDINEAGGIYSGLTQGGVGGYTRAGINAANLYGQFTGNQSGVNPYTGMAGSALGAYQGFESGTPTGEAQGALDLGRLGLQGAVQSGAMDAATAAPWTQGLGYAAIPLDLYNFAQNWQSGNTGSDAMQGAETGAAIGSVIPGIGTVIGGLVGGAAGALSSAFGGGRHDPESDMLHGLTGQYGQLYNQNPGEAQSALSALSPSQSYQLLAGAMDAKNHSGNSEQPIEATFGRMGEQNLLTQMAGQINQAYNAGQITPGESAADVYSGVVSPWLSKETGGQGLTGGAGGEAGILGGALENLTGDYMSGALTNNSQIGIAGQTDPDLQPYLGLNAGPAQALIRGTPYGGASVGYFDMNNSTPAGGAGVASYLAAKQGAKPPAAVAAEGGSMKKTMHGALDCFSDGGSAYSDYYNFSDGSGDNSGIWSDQSIFGGSDPGSLNLDLYSGSSNPYGGSYDNTGFNSSGADTVAASDNYGSGSGSGSSGSWLSSLGHLLTGSGGSSGGGSGGSNLGQTLGQLAKSYGWLLPLIGAATGSTNSKQAQPIAPPAGMASGPSRPYSTPSFQRQAVQFPSNTDWYTYGEHPEQQFFTNNQLPYVQGFSPAGQAPGSAGAGGMQSMPVMSRGGALDFAEGSGQHFVEGPGDGTSDDIPAQLSDGEYVMDAGTVSMLGNGSNEAGARRLDQLRENIRKHAGKQLVKGKQFMKAKPPEAYLRGRGKEQK